MSEFIDPNQVLQQLGLKKDMIAADFGCGSGGWVIPLSQILEDGLVYAIDVMEQSLDSFKEKENIRKILADVEKRIQKISDSSCDLVLMTNLLFQVEDKEGVFKEADRVLKKGGMVLVVDYIKDASFGPVEKITEEEVRKLGKDTGFQINKEFKAGDHHFTIIFKK